MRTTDDFRFFAWFCALAVFHTPGGVSPPERAFTLHLVFEKSESLLHIVFANKYLQTLSELAAAPEHLLAWSVGKPECLETNTSMAHMKDVISKHRDELRTPDRVGFDS